MPISQRQAIYLDAMGIERWQRQGSARASETVMDGSLGALVPPGHLIGMDWEGLQEQVQSCTRCELHASRTQTVFGVGNRQASLMLIGEAPGADEDHQGEPFVGRAGQLLNEMLRAIGLHRSDVYIANILKCRPPNNRDPKPEEATACVGYLLQQIDLIKPKLILALGRIAAQRLLQTDTPLARLRQSVHVMPDTQTPFVVTYHPAYLLRSPLDKRKAWQDLLFVKKNIESN
jgi:DNA polymerase